MSATGRGATRAPLDFYGTPEWCVRRYLDKRCMALPGNRWLEPSAGNGAIIRAVNAWYAVQALDPVNWVAVDICPLAPGIAQADFLAPDVTTANKFDLCIGNPPYSLAMEFIEKGLTVAHEVAFLLRLNFLETDKRAEFFHTHPCDVHVLPNRPSFTTDGHTDATAYAWFEFGAGHTGKIDVLALTSKAERLADRQQAA